MITFIFGPGGSGKTTLVSNLIKQDPSLHQAVSATTRSPRPGEIDGRDYYFLTPAEFNKRTFFKVVQVGDHQYGYETTEFDRAGLLVVFAMSGATYVYEKCDGPNTRIILIDPSHEVLEKRLLTREKTLEKARARLAMDGDSLSKFKRIPWTSPVLHLRDEPAALAAQKSRAFILEK